MDTFFPKYLFRYRSVGSSLAHTLDEINGKIWCATASTLNDPFDGVAKATKKELATGFSKKKLVTTWGVACFSEDWNGPTMWAHYANNHSGVCLVYDSNKLYHNAVNPVMHGYEDDVNATGVQLLQVEYLDSFPDSFTSDIEAIKTKSKHWSYEREWRLAINYVSDETMPLKVGTTLDSEGSLTEILVNENTDASSVRAIIKVANSVDPNISIVLVKPNLNEVGYKRIEVLSSKSFDPFGEI